MLIDTPRPEATKAAPTAPPAPAAPTRPKRPWAAKLVVPLAMLAAAGIGVFSALFARSASPLGIVILLALPMPAIVWRWPQVSVVIIVLATATLEQFEYFVADGIKGADTQHIPFFRSIINGAGLSPAELFFGMCAVIWLMQSAARGHLRLPKTPLTKAILVYVGLVVVYFLYGVGRGGEVKIALWEIRPPFYLALAYMITSVFVETRTLIRAVLWVMVLGSGFKAIQGVQIFMAVRKLSPRPEATLAHEESWFFGMFFALTALMWVFQYKGPLRRIATALLPLVILANLGNSRRNAWAILGLESFLLFALAYNRLPDRRKMLRKLAAVAVAGSCVYFPAFWNSEGGLGQPARAVRSAIAPSARDLTSNQYREAEDANLVLNIQESRGIGKGFGQPIHYAIPIQNLTDINSAIAFIPHNGILYIWMRMGAVGEILFLSMVSAMLLRSLALLKVEDRELSMLGAFAACGILAYVVQGYNDLGFFWFRISLCLGVLLGIVEVGLRIAHDQKTIR